MSPQKPPDEPLKQEQILLAIRRSGFPLEIRLLRALTDAGFDPSIGMRFLPKEGEKSAEVDLIARCGGPLPNGKGSLYLTATIEAKQLGRRMNFVGFKWRQPDDLTMRVSRIRFSGMPTCRVLGSSPTDGGFTQLLLGGSDPNIASALDPLNEPPVCPHWAYVRETRDLHHVEVRKDDDVRESFAKLVRVTTGIEQKNASFMVQNAGKPLLLQLSLFFPTIILSTPHLYLYDSLKETIEETDSLILQEYHEFDGVVYQRYIDVITEDALPRFIERYNRAKDNLMVAVVRHSAALHRIAEEQQTEYRLMRQPR